MKNSGQLYERLWIIGKISIVILVCLITLFPIWWLVTTSFKQKLDIFVMPPKIIFKPTLINYLDYTVRSSILPRYLNTVVIAASTTVFSMIVGSMAAYALAKARFLGSNLLSYLIIVSRLIPPIVIVIPLFMIFYRLHLVDTYPAMVLAYSSFVLPYVVWLMRGYFKEIPSAIVDSALTDGCSPFGAFMRVVVPCSLPSMAATAVFCVILCWNEFLFALALAEERWSTVPIAMTTLTYDIERGGVVWGPLAAVGTLTIIPVIILGFAVQKVLVRGMTLGAVNE